MYLAKEGEEMKESNRLLSVAGLIYFYIRQKNEEGEKPTISQVTNALGLTRRTVWGYLSLGGFLLYKGYMSFNNKGRKNLFFISRDPLTLIQNIRSNSPESQFFTTDGLTLIYIIRNPGCTIENIVTARFLTKRSVWGYIGNLRRAGLIRVKKDEHDKRIYCYFFNGDGLTDFVAKLEKEALKVVKARNNQ